jgi:hypothetical protein
VKVNQLVSKASTSARQLRQDPAIRLTLYLLLGVFGLGILSAIMGYLFGHESLKGVTQPDMNPFVASSAQGQYPREGGGYLVKESDILAKVERETKGISKSGETKKSATATDKKEAKSSPSPSPEKNQQSASLPATVKSQGVRLEVRALTVESDGFTLDVTMRNESAKEVQFLYDFLDIADDHSQSLSAEVKGLPTKFSPKSETFNGVIKVTGVSSNAVKWISFGLADYPDQTVDLKIPKILIKQK